MESSLVFKTTTVVAAATIAATITTATTTTSAAIGEKFGLAGGRLEIQS